MLRPATPLSILLFIAFVLLLLSVISTPVVKGIPLATFDGIDFGVFGFCKGNSCTGPHVGYSTGEPIDCKKGLAGRCLLFSPISNMIQLFCKPEDSQSNMADFT